MPSWVLWVLAAGAILSIASWIGLIFEMLHSKRRGDQIHVLRSETVNDTRTVEIEKTRA
jgi:hypothetical protein